MYTRHGSDAHGELCGAIFADICLQVTRWISNSTLQQFRTTPHNWARILGLFLLLLKKIPNKMKISPQTLQSIGTRTQFPSAAYATAASHATDTTSTVTHLVRRTKRIPPPNYFDSSDDDSDGKDNVEVVGGRGRPYAAAEPLAMLAMNNSDDDSDGKDDAEVMGGR